MPNPPRVGLFTRYVLENPYPLGLLLLALGLGVLWTMLQSGNRQRLWPAVMLLVLGAAVLLTGAVMVTSGERARAVVTRLVDVAVAGDVPEAMALFTDNAALVMGSPINPGYPSEAIQRRIERLDDRYRIGANQVMQLDAYTESADRATVYLGCSTTLESGFGPVPTHWLVRVERQADGAWKITHVTWLSIAGRAPTADMGS